jgi:tetratricopeptide (TPR) repeat protein
LGRLDLARRDYERAIELDPNCGEAYTELGQFSFAHPTLMADYPPGTGLAYSKRGAELLPTQPKAHALLGWSYSGLGQKEDAAAAFRKAAELCGPASAEAYFLLAEADLQLGDGRGALANLGKCLALSSDPYVRQYEGMIYNKIGVAHTTLGEDDLAFAALRKAVELPGNSSYVRARSHWALGDYYDRKQDYAAAFREFTRSVELNPSDYVNKRLAWYHFRSGDYRQALSHLTRAVELRPDDVSNLVWIPESEVAACPDEHFRTGFLALADRTIELIRDKPATKLGGEAEAHLVRGRLRAALNQPERARADFGRALLLFQQRLERQQIAPDPGLAGILETMCQLVIAGAKAGDFDRARPVLLDLLARLEQPGEPAVDHGVLAELGRALLESRNFAEAEPVLRACATIREKKVPDGWQRFNALSMLGGALLGQKKYDDASPLLLRGYEGLKEREGQLIGVLRPRLTEAVERLVRFYEEKNQPDKAREWREKLPPEVAPPPRTKMTP